MKTPDDVAEMLRLRTCGWGIKRIARELGCCHRTVKAYVVAGGVKVGLANHRNGEGPNFRQSGDRFRKLDYLRCA